MEFDVTELREFAQKLTANTETSPRKIRAVVARGALNVKKDLQAEMGKSGHFGQLARSIDYDIRRASGGDAFSVEAEIGPNKARAGGALANVAYFGTSRGGGTVADPREALEREVPNLMDYLADFADEVI